MAVVIERLDRWGHVAESHYLEDDSVTVGRAYDCDYLLQDPYVDPHHLRIEPAASGGFLVTDLGSANGVCVSQGKKRQFVSDQQTALSAGDILHLGTTRLRLIDPAQAVEPALPLNELQSLRKVFGSWWLFLVSAGLAITTTVASDAMADPFAENWYGGLFAGLACLFAAAVYGAVWTGVARAQGREPRFIWHANFAMLALITIELLSLLQPILHFNFEWLFLADSLIIVFCLAFFALLFASMLLATRLSLVRSGVAAAALPLLLGGMLVSQELDVAEFSAVPAYRLTLVSPAFQWVRGVEQREFLQRTQEVYALPENDLSSQQALQ